MVNRFGIQIERKDFQHLLPEYWYGKETEYVNFWRAHSGDITLDESGADEISANAAETAEYNSGMGSTFWAWLREEK